MHIQNELLNGWLKANPFHNQRLKIFGRERPYFNVLVFTKNSPLTRIFHRGISKMNEHGSIDQLWENWFGVQMVKSEEVPTHVLGPGQVSAK